MFERSCIRKYDGYAGLGISRKGSCRCHPRSAFKFAVGFLNPKTENFIPREGTLEHPRDDHRDKHSETPI